MKYRGIIFDLDGTLINTLGDLTDAMNHSLAQLGCPLRTQKECRRMIGNGLAKFAERALPENCKHLRDNLQNIMVSHYQQHCLIKTAPYEEIEEIVRLLGNKGVRLAVLTNKNQEPAEAIVRHFWDDGVFDPVIGICCGRKIKPDPQITLEILEQWQLAASEVIFVGDSEVDMQTANAAGVTPVGCEWGFRNKEQLQTAGAEILIQNPLQLLDILS